MQCDLLEAQSQLSRLVQAALAGDDVIIADNGVPLLRLVKVEAQSVARKPGAWAGLPKAKVDWDACAANRAIADGLTGSKVL